METSVNNKCKAFTSLEQSRKLAEFLPIESADMCFNISQRTNMPPLMTPYGKFKEFFNMEETPDFLIPCWSLAALLRELPDTMLGKDKDGYVVMVETMGSGPTAFASDPIDACVEMIIKLHEQKLL